MIHGESASRRVGFCLLALSVVAWVGCCCAPLAVDALIDLAIWAGEIAITSAAGSLAEKAFDSLFDQVIQQFSQTTNQQADAYVDIDPHDPTRGTYKTSLTFSVVNRRTNQRETVRIEHLKVYRRDVHSPWVEDQNDIEEAKRQLGTRCPISAAAGRPARRRRRSGESVRGCSVPS